ncbi:MAG: hypothetical protein GYB19_10195 [Rhodospirillales bacterium]|nr:hypothetical protein [Rhodospirillales bacterium]
MADEDKKTGKDDILKSAIDRFQTAQQGTSFNREAHEEDTRFSRMSEQWPEAIKKQRDAENRPCLTINKLPAFIRQVVNDARQNKPGIMVSPVDNGADPETAEVINGLVRSIERGSNADVAYDTAIDHAVTGGYGFFYITIEYAHDESFDLEARIERVPNPQMVHWDPNSTKFDASDWEYAFISDWLTKDEFKAQYPNAEPVSFEGDWQEWQAEWINEDKVRVSKYWERKEVKRKLIMLQSVTGERMTIREDRLDKMAQTFFDEMELVDGFDHVEAFLDLNAMEVVNERDVMAHEVKCYTMSGVEILDEEEWPGSTIPICPVWGDEVIVDGRRYFHSMIRDAKDPQRMFNFWRSSTTELVALAPKAPWVGPKGFVPKDQKAKWDYANTRNFSYLEYDQKAGGPPRREPFAGVPAGALQESLNASDDMKSIIGIYDSSLGARSNETSGRAIMARQREADVSNFHFIDNLNRAIRYAGQVLVEIIPAVYSPRETLRILGEDMKEEVVKLISENQTPGEGERLYDLSVGKYDVTVKSGPSYATQREETREVLIELMRAIPDAAPFIGDVLLEHMDFVGSEKVAERLKMLLPPAIQQKEGVSAPMGQPQVTPGMPQGGPGQEGAPGGAPIPRAV